MTHSDWQGGHPSGLQFYDKEILMNSGWFSNW